MNTILKKKVLVLGSTGMLGHQVVNYLKYFNELIVNDISYRNKLRKDTIIINAMDKASLESVIIKLKPDFIINCIGVLIKGSHNEEEAIYLNSYLPHQLKRLAKNINSKLIHISTDCVFSGGSGQYVETDPRDGQGIYSQTKILGEIIDETNLTLRTSIIGPELKKTGTGLFNWFMSQSGSIEGYKKTIWSGVTTLELSKAIYWAINNEIYGIYHITNNLKISKNDLISLIKLHTRKSIKIIPVEGNMSDKSLIDTRALLNYEIPSYDEMVREMIADISKSINLYKHYKL